MQKSSFVRKYTFFGAFAGFLFIFGAFFIRDSHNALYFIICTAPVVLGFLGRQIGMREVTLQEGNKLDEEIKIVRDRLDLALAGAKLGVWDWNLQDNSVQFDRRWCEMIGLDVTHVDMSLDTWESRVHPDDLESCYHDIKRYLDGETDWYENIHRMRHSDGHWVYILDQGRISERDSSGKPIRFTGTHLNITHFEENRHELQRIRLAMNEAEKVGKFGVWQIDTVTRSCRVSSGYQTILGEVGDGETVSFDQFVKSICQDDREKVIRSIDELIAGGRDEVAIEYRIENESGIRTLDCRARVVQSENSTLEVIGSVHDVSLLKKALREGSLYKTVLDQSSIVAFTDRKGTITEVNDLFCDISGYKREEVIGQDHRILNSGKMGSEFFGKMWKRISSGKMWRGEICNRSKDGRLYWVDTTISPIFDRSGKIEQFVAIRTEITNRKLLEMELLESREQAIVSVKAKSAFLANMSHEIRTPMNGIIGIISLLLTEIEDSEVQEKLKIVERCGRSLLDIINDILDFSKLEAEKVVLDSKPYNPVRSTFDVIELLGPKALETGVSLEFENDSEVDRLFSGDENRIKQILINLIGNGIKFAPKGTIHVTLAFVTSNDGEYLNFSVKDSGIGIPEDRRDELFKPFSQVDASSTRRFGGTGLGLAISRELIRRMGGEMWLESEEGKGSNFIFQLPAREASADAVDNVITVDVVDESFGGLYPVNILVVEDNSTNQIVARGMLQKLGYTIKMASNGIEALEATANERFDVVFMDCHMPEMDGFEATTKLIERDGEYAPFVIAMTASTMKEDVDRCMEVGMRGFVSKPISLKSVANEIKKLFSGSSQSEKAS